MSTRNPQHSRNKNKHSHLRGRRDATTVMSSSKTYWLYGIHAVEAALLNPERTIRRIIAVRDLHADIPHDPRYPKPEILEYREIELMMGPGAVHQGIACEVEPLEHAHLDEVIRGDKPLILLDQVTDPHNVGAILRSAAAFDAAAVIMTKDHSPSETAVMAKAASGALDLVPLVTVVNLAAAIREIQEAGYWTVGLTGEAKQTITEAKLSRKTALVLGAEGHGMRRLTAESCDILAKLPISERMESLNVSNAAAVALYTLYST